MPANPKKHCTIHKRKPLCIMCIFTNISVLLLSWNIDAEKEFCTLRIYQWILCKTCIKYTQSHLPRFTITMLRGRNAATDEDPLEWWGSLPLPDFLFFYLRASGQPHLPPSSHANASPLDSFIQSFFLSHPLRGCCQLFLRCTLTLRPSSQQI